MANSKATISDVAKLAGVSKATVSNYLNNRQHMMKPETCEKIRESILTLDYVPSLSARRLSAKAKSKTICLVITGDLSNLLNTMYYPTVFDSIGAEASKLGYSTLIYVKDQNKSEQATEYLLGMSKTFADGFMIFDLTQETRYFKEFEKYGIPYICVGEIHGYSEYNFVATDHGQGLYDSMEYLIHLGHKRFAIFTLDLGSVVDCARKGAYRKCLEDYKLPEEESCYECFDGTDVHEEQIKEAFKRHLSDAVSSTAVIVSAALLYYLKGVMKELGLTAPKDISIIVLDYFEKHKRIYPVLENKTYSRVLSKASQVAKIAFHKLIDEIEGRKKEKYVTYREPAGLTIGETTGPAAGE